MTREHAEAEIQRSLAEIGVILSRIRELSDEFKIEFSVLGMTMHYQNPYGNDWETGLPYPPAKEGLLVSDSEWKSSEFGCNGMQRWIWANWPEED